MSNRVLRIAAMLFAAGLCALVYQVAWLRELRLAFGTSQAATGAVLGVGLVGFGVGGALLGHRADKHKRPLELFSRVELALSGFAALSPGVLWLMRLLYARVGGASVLGDRNATLVRIALALIAVGLPAALMGGALSAAGRAVEAPEDARRHHHALIAGAHGLGAAAGALLSSLVLLELLGTRLSVWAAALLNVGLAMAARRFAGSLPTQVDEPMDDRPVGASRRPVSDATVKLDLNPDLAPPTLVLGGAGIVGFAFLLMYEVYCRMLTPLLGGSSYASGLTLAAALLGIGLGGTAFAIFAKDSPASIGRFALGCAVQALCLALPYALGDRVAVLAVLMRPLGGLGLSGHVVAWAVIAAIVVLPAALVAGLQLPLLVALLGRGSFRAGRHVGLVHAAASAGALAGALAGGLAFVPLLTATGAWRLCAAMVAALGVGAMVLAILQRQQTRRAAALTLIATGFTAGFLLLARGPTAAWRQGQVGSGSADDVAQSATRNSLREWVHAQRARVVWSAEGRESNVALATHDGLTLLADGQSQGDAGRGAAAQIMGGLLGAMLHPRPARALVLGLGNGSAAGWLAQVAAVEKIDVVELEPTTLKVARELSSLNKGVLENKKVRVLAGDARELVTSSRERYDLIVSQLPRPGNEAGANLFTREFYSAVAAHLTDGGTFVQRVQAYEVDGKSIRTIYATLASVFPVVETWQTKLGELCLLASRQAILHSVPALRQKIQEEPYKSALAGVWRVDDLEGLIAHYVAHPALALVILQQEGGEIATDDRNPLEYAYARGAGRRRLFDARELHATARYRKEARPALVDGDVDWARVDEAQIAMYVVEGIPPSPLVDQGPELRKRVEVYRRYAAGLLDAVLPVQGAREPASLIELEMISEALADAGDVAAMPLINKLMLTQPAEGGAIAARLLWRQGKLKEASDYLVPSFRLYAESPWPLPAIMRRSLEVAVDVGGRDKALGLALYQQLQRPFAADLLQAERRRAVLELGFRIDFEKLCVEALAPYEPEVPWRRQLLTRRFQCYQATHHPLAQKAQKDLEAFLEDARAPFAQGLADASAGPLDDAQ